MVEKKATVAGEGRRPDAKCDDLSSVAAVGPRANIVNGFVLAIVGAGGEQGGCVVSTVAMGGCPKDEVGLGTDGLRLAETSMTATTTQCKLRCRIQSQFVSRNRKK